MIARSSCNTSCVAGGNPVMYSSMEPTVDLVAIVRALPRGRSGGEALTERGQLCGQLRREPIAEARVVLLELGHLEQVGGSVHPEQLDEILGRHVQPGR